MSEQICNWCNPNENGEFSMYEFMNPTDPEQKATVSVYGGVFTAAIDEPGSSTQQRLSFPVRYCPFCGKQFDGKEGRE